MVKGIVQYWMEGQSVLIRGLGIGKWEMISSGHMRHKRDRYDDNCIYILFI